jgi:hypothetical protein
VIKFCAVLSDIELKEGLVVMFRHAIVVWRFLKTGEMEVNREIAKMNCYAIPA